MGTIRIDLYSESKIRMPPFITFLGQTYATYTALITFVCLLAMLRQLIRTPYGKRLRMMDSMLFAVILGVLVGRAGHVWLNDAYFSIVPDEAWQIGAGGLNWHGALVGAFVGFVLMARIRGVVHLIKLDQWAWVLGALMFVSWVGCGANLCAYGAPVNAGDYPAWLLWDVQDSYGIRGMRFATQVWGAIGAFTLLLLNNRLHRYGWLEKRRFWIMLLLISLMQVIIGFGRGDYAVMVDVLRLEQWLSLGMGLFAVVMLLMPRPSDETYIPEVT